MRNNPCENCQFALIEEDSIFEKCTLGRECDAFVCDDCGMRVTPQQYQDKDGLCMSCYYVEYEKLDDARKNPNQTKLM